MSSYTGGKNEWHVFRGSVDRKGCIKKYLSSMWHVSNILDLALGEVKVHLASNIGKKIDRESLRVSFPATFISPCRNGWKKNVGATNYEAQFSKSHGLRLEPKSAEVNGSNSCAQWCEQRLATPRCCIGGKYAALLKAELSHINERKHCSTIEVKDRSLVSKRAVTGNLRRGKPTWNC